MTWLSRIFGDVNKHEDKLRFRCNLCGRDAIAPKNRFSREEKSCKCGSTVRQRALMHVLSMELFGESLPLADFPRRPDIVGVDMSGATTYSNRLAGKLGYINTFLHKAPRLDITDPDHEWFGKCDFVISSDVFEHVPPPVDVAFSNVHKLLKPGGLFLLTVPYAKHGSTVEHFPELHEYQIQDRNGNRRLINTTRDGRNQLFENLIFHGGEGETLEMRVFSESGVLNELHSAGFENIRTHGTPRQEFGILWQQDWSLPITATRAGP